MGKVFVTGASGFAGRYLMRELLRRGFRAAASGRCAHLPRDWEPQDRLEWIPLDLSAPVEVIEAALQRAAPDAVVHLAAQSDVGRSWRDPVETWEANVLGTVRLVEALRRLRVPRLIHVGSGDVYGTVASPEELPLREDRPPRPNNPYAKSKLAGELAATLFGGLREPEVVLLRPFAHAGPGQRPDFVCASFARQVARVKAGLQPPIIRTGNLDARRDLSDVRDIAAAYADAIDKAPPGVPLNVCSGQSRRVGDILARLAELAGARIDIQIDPAKLRPVDTPEIRGDATRFREATGWRPQVDFDQTLADLLEWEERQIAQEREAANFGAP
jgi:GDP-4-dehydro-6-deoxy-D-mannose reductase